MSKETDSNQSSGTEWRSIHYIDLKGDISKDLAFSMEGLIGIELKLTVFPIPIVGILARTPRWQAKPKPTKEIP